jgi:ribonuclease P protein component
MASSGKLAVLRDSVEIAAIRKEGQSFSNRFSVLVTRKNTENKPCYAVIASRKVGGAVKRNRCKRRMRSRVKMLAHRIAKDYNFVLIARPELLDVDPDTLDKSIIQLFQRAGLLNSNE